ncbi:MAG: hypothetical protein F6K10_32545 [Moorea sp. SIO2B7]|nr:hypothetical protein [Moorena sp. SIO2B7]
MSKENKRKVGRPSLHGVRKKSYSVMATETAWNGVKEMAKTSGLSLSEFIETLGLAIHLH